MHSLDPFISLLDEIEAKVDSSEKVCSGSYFHRRYRVEFDLT